MPEFERDLQTIKEDIRARSDIVEVIGQYTRLKQAGKSWKGLCPFHADKRPSFDVSPSMQYYRCWSCGEKGDVFTFIEKKENLDFLDAMEFLARRAGIPFERRGVNPEQTSEREKMFALNTLATRYYQERLSRSPDAQAYLAKRGILKPTQEHWDLGFAPNEWEGLTYYLERQSADLALAARLGLIKVRQPGGSHYDTFRNRLMFPIHDVQGRVIAFGGRAMGDDPAKYLNSEQSPLFDKSRTLYGLVFARKVLGANTPAVFVEGYVDVITTHQAGFTQCVATLGTSMTEEHARLLVRYSPRVVICYDADSAGTKATLRGAAVWESIGVEGAEVRVATLPPGQDPDSLVLSGQTAAFQHALDNAVPRVDFEIEQALTRHAIDTEDGRGSALAEIIPIIARVELATQRDKYIEKIARLHPAWRTDYQRARRSLLADIEAYAGQTGGAQSPRDRGFPLSERANRAPLANQPAPPSYRAPSSEGWGRWEPGSRTGAGAEGRTSSGQGRFSRGGGESRQRRDPLRDHSAPPLAAPPLTGPEKAERQLLRALFTADWRSYVLSRIQPDLLITPQAREMFSIAARMPAREDGTIDPRRVLGEAEALETGPFDLPVASNAQSGIDRRGVGDLAFAAPAEIFSSGSQELNGGVANSLSAAGTDENSGGYLEESMSLRAADYRTGGTTSAKTSDFIREVLEDSLSVMSNEPLSEAALGDCIRRLRKHREEQATRELTSLLGRDDLTPQQRELTVQQYHEKMRQSRGSPPTVENDNG